MIWHHCDGWIELIGVIRCDYCNVLQSKRRLLRLPNAEQGWSTGSAGVRDSSARSGVHDCTYPPHRSTCDQCRYFPSCTRGPPWISLFVAARCTFSSRSRTVILRCGPFLRSIRYMSLTVAGLWVVPYSWKDPCIWDPSMNRIHSSKWNESGTPHDRRWQPRVQLPPLSSDSSTCWQRQDLLTLCLAPRHVETFSNIEQRPIRASRFNHILRAVLLLHHRV